VRTCIWRLHAMMALMVKLLVFVSWAALLIPSFAARAGGWLYYGYINMDCHPMFTTGWATCSIADALAAEHILVVLRTPLPYRLILIDQRDLLILLAAGAVGTAFMILIVYRIVCRGRHFDIFADMPGFSTIERIVER